MLQNKRRRCLSAVLLSFLLLASPRFSPAEPLPALDAGQKQALLLAGFKAFQEGNLRQSLSIADALMQADPQSEDGYNLAAMIYFSQKNFTSVVAITQMAKSRGIQNLFLAKYLTQALYFLGDFASAMQGFDRAEKILRADMKKESGIS